jgi:Flp pilus assembly protein TadG
VLTAFLLVALMVMSAMLLSMSYIDLSRSELRAATDAAARSAVIQLVNTQSQSQSKAAARNVASRYTVGGRAFSIRNADITFGSATQQANGSFQFSAGSSPTNAARIEGLKTASASAGAVNLPLGTFVGRQTYATQLTATAMQLDHDLVLVLDRSGSMGWDLSANEFSYPAEKADRPVLENYFSPPHATSSRWAILSDAVDEMLDILADREVSARVGLVTFANTYDFGRYHADTVTRERDLTSNYNNIRTSITSVGQKPLIGATDIAAGLTEAKDLLTTSAQARPKTAHPAIILFSDGIFTTGTDPVTYATQMYTDHKIVIHSVTFGADATARTRMNQIAAAAGKGLSLHADTADQLIASFRTIANSIPVMITE